MTERMKRFFEAAVKNEKVLEKMKSLEELSLAEQKEHITALAAEVGVTLTEDDFRQIDGTELTDEELEKAAGGGAEDMSLDELMTMQIMLLLQSETERREALETAKGMQLQELKDRISAQ